MPAEASAERGNPRPADPCTPAPSSALRPQHRGPQDGPAGGRWDGPLAQPQAPVAPRSPQLPACVRPGVPCWSTVSASCNMVLTRNRIPSVTASRKRRGRGAAGRGPSQQAGLQVGFQEGAPWSPPTPGQGPAVSPDTVWERCGERGREGRRASGPGCGPAWSPWTQGRPELTTRLLAPLSALSRVTQSLLGPLAWGLVRATHQFTLVQSLSRVPLFATP